jgi:hypothetical protein
MHILLYTDKKENQIFLIYEKIQNGAVAKSCMTSVMASSYMYMGKYLRISSYSSKPFLIYYFATGLNFLIYEGNLILFFNSVAYDTSYIQTPEIYRDIAPLFSVANSP